MHKGLISMNENTQYEIQRNNLETRPSWYEYKRLIWSFKWTKTKGEQS